MNSPHCKGSLHAIFILDKCGSIDSYIYIYIYIYELSKYKKEISNKQIVKLRRKIISAKSGVTTSICTCVSCGVLNIMQRP